MSSKTPEIRFDGFTDDWEQRKFFDNIEKVVDFRGKTPKKLGMDWSDSGYLALSALNVKNGYIDPSVDAHYGSEELYKKWMGERKLKKGQVLFTTEAPMGNVAQVPDNKGYILSQRTISFDVNSDKITNSFLAILLKSSKVVNNLSALASGGTAKGVSQKSLTGLIVTLPVSLNEQTKIAIFFKHLEDTIAFHQRQLKNLEKSKKAFLQKMFPKNGEEISEIRFDGFTEDWEQRKWNEAMEVNSGRDYKHLGHGDIPVYGTGGYMLSVNAALSSEDSIGIGRKGTIDKPQYLSAPFWTVDTLFYMTPLKGYDINFLYFMAQNINWKKLDESTGVPSLSKVNITRIIRNIPNIEEQLKVGYFFNQLDKTIALHQRQLENLKQTKKAFLQKMFV